jgi:hypothetical protein
MTFKTKLVGYVVAALVATALADVIGGLGPLVLMCAYAGIVAAWAIEPEADAAHTNANLKKAA